VERQKLALNLIVQKPDRSWLGPIGSINDRHLLDYMPYPNENSLILTAGSRSFTDEVVQHCRDLGFRDVHC